MSPETSDGLFKFVCNAFGLLLPPAHTHTFIIVPITYIHVAIVEKARTICTQAVNGTIELHSEGRPFPQIQWNLRIKDTLGQGVLSFIERFPLFRG